jgi:plasmid maintenance system antidote protein VapI
MSSDKHDPFELLREFVRSLEWGEKTKFAETLGIHQSRLSHIVRDRERPTVEVAVAIQRETGIPAHLFHPILKDLANLPKAVGRAHG